MGELSQLFAYTSYTPLKAFLGKMLNVLATFLWSYTDVFVILMSVGISTLFKQVNKNLFKYKGQVNSIYS